MIGGDPAPQSDEIIKENTFPFITGVVQACLCGEEHQTK
jgi:hypothetical protein